MFLKTLNKQLNAFLQSTAGVLVLGTVVIGNPLVANLNSLTVNAQETNDRGANITNRGLVASPVIIELEAQKDNSYNLTVNLENDSNSPIELSAELQKFTSSAEEGAPVINPLEETDLFASWFNFESNLVSLAPGENKDFNIQVAIPADAPAGGYFIAPTFIQQPSSNNSSANQVLLEQRLAVLVFMEIEGQVTRELEIVNISSDKQIIDPFLDSVELEYILKLNGNTYYKPSGNLKFSQNPEEALLLNPEGKIIMPNSQRSFSTNIKPMFNLQNNCQDSLRLFGDTENLDNCETIGLGVLGPSTVSTETVFLDSRKQLITLNSSANVFLLPWKSALLLGLIAAIVFSSSKFYFSKKAYK